MPETNRIAYKAQLTQHLDLEKEVVEQLGSGILHILKTYGKACFHFSENFLRMELPASEKLTPQGTPQVESFLKGITGEHSRQELQEKFALSDREYFRKVYLQPAIDVALIELAIPESPRSSKQRYRITEKWKAVLSQ